MSQIATYLLFGVSARLLVHPVLALNRLIDLVSYQIDQLLDLFDRLRIEVVVDVQAANCARVVGLHEGIAKLKIRLTIEIKVKTKTSVIPEDRIQDFYLPKLFLDAEALGRPLKLEVELGVERVRVIGEMQCHPPGEIVGHDSAERNEFGKGELE